MDKIIKRIGEEGKGGVRVAFDDAGYDASGDAKPGETSGNKITIKSAAVNETEQGYSLNQTAVHLGVFSILLLHAKEWKVMWSLLIFPLETPAIEHTVALVMRSNHSPSANPVTERSIRL